jgi:hypothetical protein
MKAFHTFLSETKDNRVLAEAALGGFDKIIQAALDEKEMKVQGTYTIKASSHQLKIDRRDVPTFKKLFKLAPDKTVGNGEVSLYWLFNYGGNHGRATEARGGNQPDLVIDNIAVEVKAYPKHDNISLGRFQDRRLFRSLANTLFGVANLFAAFEGGKGRGEQSFKGELSFRYPDLLDAANKFLELRALLNNNPQLAKSFPIFKQMANTISSFEKEIKTLGYKVDMKDANSIAVALMRHLIEVSLGEKPGDGGYLLNLKDKDPTDIWLHHINFKKMVTDEKVLIAAGTFTINGGVFKANFRRLFP